MKKPIELCRKCSCAITESIRKCTYQDSSAAFDVYCAPAVDFTWHGSHFHSKTSKGFKITRTIIQTKIILQAGKLKNRFTYFSRHKRNHLRLANNYSKIPAATITVLLILFFVRLETVLAQRDTLKSNSEWNSGVLALKDQTIMEGFIQHDEKLRSIKFKAKLENEAEMTFAETAIVSMEYFDKNISKTREFYTWDVIDEGNTIQGPALYEVIMVMKNFVVLSRKFGVLPTQGRHGQQEDDRTKIEYDKVEKIFLGKEGARAELLSLAPLENEKPNTPSLIQPFLSGDIMKKYTGSFWPKVKLFVKKNRLNLKRRADLMEALTYYQQIEKAY